MKTFSAIRRRLLELEQSYVEYKETIGDKSAWWIDKTAKIILLKPMLQDEYVEIGKTIQKAR